MFYVFGPSGQVFRGSPEQLAQVAPVRRVSRSQALHAGGVGEREGRAQSQTAAPPAGARAQGALAAYASTEQAQQPARQQLTRVADVMTSQAITVSHDARVGVAWHLLAEYGVAQAPVVQGAGVVVGLLLRADMESPDLLDATRMAAMAARMVGEVMVSPVPTVSPDTSLRRLATVLLACDLPGLPVTDDAGRVAGFVSRTDILRAVAAEPPLDLWT